MKAQFRKIGLTLAVISALVLTGCGGGSASEPTTPSGSISQNAGNGTDNSAVVASNTGTRGIAQSTSKSGETGGDTASESSNESSGPETCSADGGGRGGDVCGAGDTDGEQ